MAPMTTFRVGGPARYFVEAKTHVQVSEALEFVKRKKLPLFVLGGGSNLVVSDDGFPGLVLKIGITRHRRAEGKRPGALRSRRRRRVGQVRVAGGGA